MAENSLTCEVCGQNDFTLTEGFYYCMECGTQTRQLYDIQVESDEDTRYCKTTKIKTSVEKPELTSWECFNYLLRGLVDELLELGAKEELKITALQLWATYLKKSEVAFFDKINLKLPKLGPRFSTRDAKILYNQEPPKKKRKLSSKSVAHSISEKVLRKKKRKFIESEFGTVSQKPSSNNSSYTTSISQHTASTATTRRAIRLEFNKTGRKYFKKLIPKYNMVKHENDANSEMDCHIVKAIPTKNLPKKYRDLQLGRKTIYSILFLALNLIEDDIQLHDLLRFMREGHLSSTKIAHLFPENVAENCEKVINSKNFCSKTPLFRDSVIRRHAALLCKLIYIPNLKIPNIIKLTRRFVTDLCLPTEIATFIERLIQFCPPDMHFRFQSEYTPCYEGRAMAYIIFVLKLLFGLDDVKEKAISRCARKINQKLSELNYLKEEKKKLFVWEEWRNYIEMRKIVLTQCHFPTSLSLKQNVNSSHFIDHLNFEQGITEEEVVRSRRVKIQNMEKIFDSFQIKFKNNSNDGLPETLKFPPSLTPNKAYLENILENPPSEIYIPDLLREADHSELDVMSFLKPSKLRKFFQDHFIQINVKRLQNNSNHNTESIFRNFCNIERRQYFKNVRFRKPTFDINEEQWLERIWKEDKAINISTISQQTVRDKVKVKTKKKNTLIDQLLDIIAKNQSEEKKNLKRNEEKNVQRNEEEQNSSAPIEEVADNNNTYLPSRLNSFDIFSEKNMLPLDKTTYTQPRRNLENFDLFANLSDDDESEFELVLDTQMDFLISNLDYWIFFGEMIKLPDALFLEVLKKLPSNFVWLLDACSEMSGIDREYIYQELLTIENYFIYVLEPIKEFKNKLVFKKKCEFKDLANRIETYKLLW